MEAGIPIFHRHRIKDGLTERASSDGIYCWTQNIAGLTEYYVHYYCY